MTERINEKPRFVRHLDVVLLVALVGIALWSIFLARTIIVDVLLACVLASVLYPPVQWLQSKRWPRRLSILIFYLLLLIIVAGVAYLIGNIAMEQGRNLLESAPYRMERLSSLISGLPFVEGDDAFFRMISENLRALGEKALGLMVSTFDYVMVLFNGMIHILIILTLTFFLLADTHYFHDVFLKLFPPDKRAEVGELLPSLAIQVGGYVRGQLLVMSFVGILTWIGLSIVGLQYAFILGMLAFFLDIIPIIGPIFATIVGTLIALGTEPSLAGWTLLVFFVVQQLESYVIYPKVLGETTGLHPAWVFLALLTGGAVAGISGVLLAIPAALLINILMHRHYFRQ